MGKRWAGAGSPCMVEIDHEHDGLLVDLAAAHVTASLKAVCVVGKSQETGREARSLPLGLYSSPAPAWSTVKLPTRYPDVGSGRGGGRFSTSGVG